MNSIASQNASVRKLIKLFFLTTFITTVVCCSVSRIEAAGNLIPAPSRFDMVYDGGRDLVYITNGGEVLRYQISTNTFISPLVFGRNLRGLDLSPDGNTLVVAEDLALGSTVTVTVVPT